MFAAAHRLYFSAVLLVFLLCSPAAGQVVPALTEMLKDKDADVRRAAASALGQIGPKAKTAVPALTELLRDEEENVRSTAAQALAKIGAAAVPALTELLKDKDEGVRMAAVEILGQIGPGAKTAVPALTQLRKREFGLLHSAAARALQKIRAAEEDADVRGAGAPALGQVGPEATSAAVKFGKASTALVESKDKRSYCSAFCIDPSGLFITTAHGVPAQGAAGTLVMNSGLKTQKVFKANVVRHDKQLDLALLRAEGVDKLSALSLGSVEDLEDLMELVVFGLTTCHAGLHDRASERRRRVQRCVPSERLRPGGRIAEAEQAATND